MLLINDIARHAEQTRDQVEAACQRVIKSGWFILGKEVRAFEEEFAAYCQTECCVGVANGTDALEIALRSVGVTRGSRVAAVANAGFYVCTALQIIGADPVFIDVDPDTKLMSAVDLHRASQEGPLHAVVATHLYGLLLDTQPILAITDRIKIPLVEDCAQAHGTIRNGRRAGSFGKAAAFSFYPTKNLGALGDGGAIVTSDATVAEQARRLRQYGWGSKYRVETSGGRNSRLDEIQAAILRTKLPCLDAWNSRRIAIAQRYSIEIRHPSVRTPRPVGEGYVAHLYVIETEHRDELRAHLSAAAIATDVHYPVPDHMQPIHGGRRHRALPTTEMLAKRVLTLPCFPEMTDEEVAHVIVTVNRW